MCIRRSPYFDNFQNKKIYIYIFLFLFRSASWSNPYTRPLADPCFLKLTRAHVLPEVVKIVNWRDPCFTHMKSPEQFGKKAVLVRRRRAFRRHWQKCKKQMELEVDSGGGRGRSTVSTLASKVWWAGGCILHCLQRKAEVRLKQEETTATTCCIWATQAKPEGL